MSISPISPPAAPAPPVQVQDHDQPKAAPPAPVVHPVKKDSVTISKAAVKLASDGDTPAVELKEGAAEKATETLKGKK